MRVKIAVSGHQNVISYNPRIVVSGMAFAVSGHQNVISYNLIGEISTFSMLCLDIKT